MAADGIMGCTHLGVILYLYTHYATFYREAETFIGASIGSVWSLLLSMGLSRDGFMSAAYEFISIDMPRCISSLACRRFVSTWGLSKAAYTHLTTLVESVFGCRNPTFAMHHARFKKTLVISGFSLAGMDVVYFDHVHYPDMPLMLAVKISTAIPFFFEPVVHQGVMYVDPIIREKVPINYLFKRGRVDSTAPKGTGAPGQRCNTLVILNNSQPHAATRNAKKTGVTLKGYISQVVQGVRHTNGRVLQHHTAEELAQIGYYLKVVCIEPPKPLCVMYQLQQSDIDALVIEGYMACSRFQKTTDAPRNGGRGSAAAHAPVLGNKK